MTFLDSFAKPSTGFGKVNEVLEGVRGVTDALAENFARDPAIRASRKKARIDRQARDEIQENKRQQSGVERLRFLGKLVSGMISEGIAPPGSLAEIGKRIGDSIGGDLGEQEKQIFLGIFQQPPPGQELPDPESPIGKLQFDRRAAADQFGEGSPQVQQIDAVIGQATTEPVQPLNLIFPDGRKVGFDRVTQKEEIIQAFERGAIPVGLSVQAGEVAGLGFPGKKETQAAGAEARSLAGGIAQASATLSDLENSVRGSGSGLRGLAIEKVGGLLGQFSKGAEKGFAEFFGDASPAEVKRFRFRARSIVAGMLSSITGEESGRFTEQERAIATQALGALDATASPEQVAAGLSTALEIMLLSQDRNAITAGVQPREDLQTREGIDAMGLRLLDLGMKRDQAEEVLLRLIRQRIELRRTLPGQ